MSAVAAKPARAVGVVVGGAVLAVLAACSTPAISVETGAAPANPAKLTIAQPGDNGLNGGADWPRACSLLSDDELKAVLPQTAAVTREGSSESLKVTSNSLNSVTDSNGFPVTIDVPEAKCKLTLELPRHKGAKYADTLAFLDVSVDSVGSVETARMNLDHGGSQTTPVAGAEECYETSVSYSCRAGRVDFELDGGLAAGLRFKDQGVTSDTATTEFFFSHVLQELVPLIAAKMPST